MSHTVINDILIKRFMIDESVLLLCDEAEASLKEIFAEIDEIAEFNQLKVLHAMQKNRLADIHFGSTTGYGYNDIGRDVLEAIYADIFNAEAALVRLQLISGTHALTTALFGNLRHGDELLSPVGEPYDTLKGVIGIRKERASLAEHGVKYRQVDLTQTGEIDFDGIKKAINEKTKLVTIQRSKGYVFRHSFLVQEIKGIIQTIKSIKPDVICMVDNCYGEFTGLIEPTEVGADLCVGSLIKNMGGGLAPSGGYIAGRLDFVENAAYRLTSPGLGREVGPSLGITSSLLQGLFLAPTVVASATKTALFSAAVFERLGFPVLPSSRETRSDIVQAIRLGSPEKIISFCRGIQKAAPVDSYVTPEPWDMPGYGCDVIMAAGAFVQGASIELSADAPIRPPYDVFLQGGLTWPHGKLGVITAVNEMKKDGHILI